MKVLLEECRTETVIKNSRFIAEVFPVTDQKEAREKLHEMKQKYSDATHVVHAFMTGLQGETCGMSDDGEPSGTAGRPVLDVLKGSGITNILLTVTRYFGGTLLGTGGLVHAYGDCAKSVLEACRAEEYIEKAGFGFSCDYTIYDMVKRLMEQYHISDLAEDFAGNVSIRGKIHAEEKNALESQLKNLSKGKITSI